MRLIATVILALGFLSGLVRADTKPSILFAVPGENRYFLVGFDYMRAVANAGFAVDYVEGAQDLTWERVKKYNVVVVLDFPGANQKLNGYTLFQESAAGHLNDYFGVLEKFRAAGGGVLIHYSPSAGGGAPNGLLKQWGIQFPLIAMHDARTEPLTNLGDVNLCAFTDQVLPSPVSEGVKQIWYPINGPHYTSWHTMPVLIDSTWQPVVKAGRTAWTEVPTYPLANDQPAPGALIPTEPIKDPVLFAIRDGTGTDGRLAAIQTWHQFSIGSGMKWLFNDEILEKGLGGQSSQYGRLLLNTYHWLAEPSLKSGAVGGYIQDPVRLLEPQAKPDAMKAFAEVAYKAEATPPPSGKLFKGLIGAQTSLSGGQGSVDDYARAAAADGLDYLIILEDFAQMTPEKLDQLKEAVKEASTPTLQVFAGYRMKNNIGNSMYIYGVNPPWPPAHLLVGPNHEIFNLQYQDEHGKFVAAGAPLDWLLGMPAADVKCTVGYYDFTHSAPGAMQMHDLRAYSSAAVRTYEGGKLSEDATDDYLTTWGSTIGPVPVCLNIVQSPQELHAAVTQHESLTYVHARNLDSVWEDGLRWNGSYDGPNVFISDGPLVRQWSRPLRVCTFGAEPFVPGRSLQDAPLDVTSDVGLKEIRLYNGPTLFRRFLCQGAKEFKVEMLYPGVLHQDVVLIAEDVNGGKAVTYPVINYKEGAKGPIFCSDHVNDCASMLLGHGSVWTQFPFVPLVPDSGGTWDGGPTAKRQLLTVPCTWPALETDAKALEWGDQMPYQMPLIEFADEGATRCRMICDRKLRDDLVPLGLNPWSGFGPVEPTKLADAWSSHTAFGQYTSGVDPMAWGAVGFDRGAIACLFTQQITFKADQIINQCVLLNGWWRSPKLPPSVQFTVGRGDQILDGMDISTGPETEHTFRVETGDWFALYSGLPSNTSLVINRGPAVDVHFYPNGTYWLKVTAAFDKKAVKKGETYDTEFFGTTWPMDEKFITARSLADVVTYLAKPTGLQLARGKQVAGPGGLLELAPDNYAVDVSIPNPTMPVVVPVRVSGFNKRWSVGLYQAEGYRTHYYSKGDSGYRALGLDFDSRAYVPMYVSMAPVTHDLIGHPVIADDQGKELFIQVTCLGEKDDKSGFTWHVSVNNPTDHPVETTLHQAMDLPGLALADLKTTFQPGEYRVLELGGAAAH
jgi:hypothetical protein